MPDRELGRWVRQARTNLRRRVARRNVGFVLSGGGSQGSFEAGVLKFIYDDLGLRPRSICGSSVGAIIAAKLAEGDDELTGRRAIDDVLAIWRGLRSNEDMWLAEPWLDKLRGQVAWASELRGRAAAHGAAGSQARVVVRMLGEVVRRLPESDGTIDALRQAMRARSLLRMDPVRRLVEDNIHPERVVASTIRLRIGTVCLETGDLQYITEEGALLSRDGTQLDVPNVRLQDAILASASIPVIFPPTELGGNHYVDGGVREILPLELAFNRLDASHIFAVVASAPGVEPMPDAGDRGLFDLARRVSADIAPDETLRKEMQPPRGWGRRVSLVVPEFDVHDALTIDASLIAASLDYGYMRAADVLLDLGDEQSEITAEIARARMRIREAEGPVLGLLLNPILDNRSPEERERAIAKERARIDRLVERRREVDAPLPPGDCAPVPLAAAVESDAPGLPAGGD
ncbi:MAG TPA: patatin-like phospholipase family protein [Acidimicrobiia bacterium]|jgi:predicted acylesterase/phospholipase RssA